MAVPYLTIDNSKMNNKGLEAFIEKVDREETKGDIVAVDSLIRPRKDKLVRTIGDLYDFKLNVITGNIELNNKPISGNFLRTFYLELAEKNGFDINKDNAANVAILLAERHRYNPVEQYLNECNDPLPKEVWDNIAFHIFGSKNPKHTLHFQRQIIAAAARVASA